MLLGFHNCLYIAQHVGGFTFISSKSVLYSHTLRAEKKTNCSQPFCIKLGNYSLTIDLQTFVVPLIKVEIVFDHLNCVLYFYTSVQQVLHVFQILILTLRNHFWFEKIKSILFLEPRSDQQDLYMLKSLDS